MEQLDVGHVSTLVPQKMPGSHDAAPRSGRPLAMTPSTSHVKVAARASSGKEGGGVKESLRSRSRSRTCAFYENKLVLEVCLNLGNTLKLVESI